jgi:cobalt/nickel transport system permease protein
MAVNTHILIFPFNHLIILICGGILTGISCIFLIQRLRSVDGPYSEEERDWRIPVIDSQSSGDSPFHCWDPRIKLCALTAFMFFVASLSQIFWAITALITALGAVVVARIPLRNSLRRVTAMGTFLGMFLVVMPLTAVVKAGDTLIVFEGVDWIHFNLRGYSLALLICIKAVAIALLAEPLLSTTSFSVTIQALARLKAPSILCQMLLLAHRYIFVFRDEATRMLKGMRARGFRKQTDMETLRTIGNFLGMLLVRSFERTQRVFDAMLARGYTGTWPGDMAFRAVTGDWIKGAFWVVLGGVMFVFDRWIVAPF